MGILRRFTTLFRAQTYSTMDAAEDPIQTLETSYERQIATLRDVRRGIVEVTAAKRRLQLQDAELRSNLARLDDQARQALQMGREDLARSVLERKHRATTRLQTFEQQIDDLDAEQERLVTAEARLADKIETFRTRTEVLKAQHTAAQAGVRIGEAMSGLSEESADASYSIRRAEERTTQLRSRGEAITELINTGVLDDASDPDSALDRELRQLDRDSRVDSDLEALRRELEEPSSPRQLESGR